MDPDSYPDAAQRVGHPLPTFQMRELYHPTMVTIEVNNSEVEGFDGDDYIERTYSVQRELISRHSEYFRAAFEGQFTEASEKKATITDFHPITFEIFMDFLFYNEIAQGDDDATQWDWENLVLCYLFGNKYDSHGFRNRAFEAIQTKMLMRQPCIYNFPGAKAVKILCDSTLPSDPLRKFFADSYNVEWTIDDEDSEMKAMEDLPPEFIRECLFFARKFSSCLECRHCGRYGDREPCKSKSHTGLEKSNPSKNRWCQYHEHKTDQEKQICRWRLKAMEWKFPPAPETSTMADEEDDDL